MKSLKLFLFVLALGPLAVQAQSVQRQTSEGYNDFPTYDRVGYVLVCMDSHGGQSVETLTACSCRIDHIASEMTFQEYEDATTYLRYKRMPGEKGAIFREMEQGEKLLDKLNAARDAANKACPIARVSPDSRE